ncbi:hypothetical protein PspS35_27655 [Pseudomonas sp. S35]|uniref:lytic polysaccharide monooxygenase n=1 Tax=Pseudomonas sp. S35 TaxID=1573719 RepID=UPI00132E80FC|nr:lytic polysaccharide monooxygenase [Pseudomonas sp. S35]QHF47378.1 hypothetical protein PspS35_27655 [Pseudomonas sp. S35]
MNKYTKRLLKWTVAAALLAPALSWAHGALDFPASRAVNCQATGGYWQSEDGSSIVDKGCRESAKIFTGSAAKVFAAQQWNEVAHIPEINNPSLDQIKSIIKDGQICSANDPKKASLDQPTPYWTKTDVIPGQSLTMRLIGTAPHVPSKFYAFTSRPGFNTATDILKWSDLIQLGSEQKFEVVKTNWQTPPRLPGASGFFDIVRTIPSGVAGNGLIVGIWVRNDPNGEFFISCSDVSYQGGGVPEEPHNIGSFITADMQTVKRGDTVHFRIFGVDPARTELVNIFHKITAANEAVGQWGKEIADKVDPSIAKIGELEGQTITFNQANPLINSTYVTNKGYTQAMSIIAGEDPKPVARITGPTTLKSGQAFSFSGAGSTGSKGPLLYLWTVPGMTLPYNEVTVSGKAYNVTEPTEFKVQLLVRDQQNNAVDQAVVRLTVTPGSGGGDYPAYKEGTPYKAGDIVTNAGANYKCKPHPYTAWCAGAARAYAPGTGWAWKEAWEAME